MRTKTLLWAAALAAAATVASHAQTVFSVNAVGYVNKTIPAKSFALISNPLLAQTNTISALFSGQVPDGFQVFVWNTTNKRFDFTQYSPDFGWDPVAVADQQLKPGQGVFVKNSGTTDVKVTFVGEVPQGNLSTPLLPGLQIVSSQVPQAGTIADLGYVGAQDDKVFQWNTAGQKYDFAQFDTQFGWDPPLKPLDVGDAFFLSKTAGGTWTRNFTVNQ